MQTKNIRAAIAAVVLGTAAACGGNPGPVGPLPVGLTGVSWRLVTLGNTSPVFNTGGPDLTLRITDNRTTNGYSGCNRFHGSYMLNGDTLRFGPLISTKVACPGSLTLEQRYLAALNATNRYQLNSDSLVLYQGPTAGLVFKH